MRRKSLSWQIKRRSISAGFFAALVYAGIGQLPGAETVLTNRFLGAASCASSGCHGGGGQAQNQFLIWSLRDSHSQRAFATLTTARSKQIADGLQIKDPTTDRRCTSCHAPLTEVPSALRGEAFKVTEGVSCESCHGSAEAWLRSHTRTDYSHADRVFSGIRDLKNLYGRANNCVACHQTVETSLLTAGHPELIFELDGQSVSQPKHWHEAADWNGAQTWLVGQAVALRELSWQLSREPESYEKLTARWRALLWLLQKLDGLGSEFSEFSGLGTLSAEPTSQNFRASLMASDDLAKRVAGSQWTDELSRRVLATVAKTGGEFQQAGVGVQVQARRAERLVLALDRLLAASKQSPTNPGPEANLNRLFKLVQSLPDFDSAEFSEALNQFSKSVSQ